MEIYEKNFVNEKKKKKCIRNETESVDHSLVILWFCSSSFDFDQSIKVGFALLIL